MIISVVGSSGSGKTTLITRIVPLLKEKGLKVAVVKHVHQDFEIDRKGKDSWKIYQSGADIVISSQTKLALIRRAGESLDEICKKYLKEYDLVITEGFNLSGKERIVVLDDLTELEYFKHGRILAVVSDLEIEEYTHFRKDDVENIAEFIYRRVCNPQGQWRHVES
jgi:molybdopterin-guanine dinucleotide biosynthesis protein B